MTVTVERGIIYAEIPGYRALELDVYRDDDTHVDAVGPRPLLINIHGGGWRVSNRQRTPRETRAWERTFHERMVDAGFVVACPSYRYSAEALYPAAVDDVISAIEFLRANAQAYGADPAKTVLFGQSAGGYLALAAGLDLRIAPVQGIAAWYPLTDFSAFDDDDSAAIFPSQWLGAPLSAVTETVERSRLPRLARADAPAVLLQHGTADTMAPYDQSLRMDAALRSSGATIELATIDGAGHFFEGAADETIEEIFATTMTFCRSCTASSA